MREVLEKTNGIDWDKKVTVELSLLELQMIKDLVGESSKSKAINCFKRLAEVPCPYEGLNDNHLDLYDELKGIVKRNGGVV